MERIRRFIAPLRTVEASNKLVVAVGTAVFAILLTRVLGSVWLAATVISLVIVALLATHHTPTRQTRGVGKIVQAGTLVLALALGGTMIGVGVGAKPILALDPPWCGPDDEGPFCEDFCIFTDSPYEICEKRYYWVPGPIEIDIEIDPIPS